MGKLISNFKKKAGIFSSHFAAQCSVVNNTSKLPNLQLRTNHQLNNFTINEEDIIAMVRNLNPNKGHGCCDIISLCIIQLCEYSIDFPLKLPFKSMLQEGAFPENLEKKQCCARQQKRL